MADDKPPADEADELLMPSQVVRRFGVDPKTVNRWARAGKLDPITTPGGPPSVPSVRDPAMPGRRDPRRRPGLAGAHPVAARGVIRSEARDLGGRWALRPNMAYLCGKLDGKGP